MIIIVFSQCNQLFIEMLHSFQMITRFRPFMLRILLAKFGCDSGSDPILDQMISKFSIAPRVSDVVDLCTSIDFYLYDGVLTPFSEGA